MEKLDDYIDFKAYTRYLKKVTGEPADPEALKKNILAKTIERTEMQTAYIILSKLAIAACVILIFAFCSALYGYFSLEKDYEEDDLWTQARVDDWRRFPGERLYDAYRNSNEIKNKFH